ncbi:MAG: disulfide bond chaperone [bacterium]|nr:disulfide bond chaperone [bacterium]MDI1336229.1 disulfide bond chaperone [Lacunisphaera sp.]
MPDDQTSEVTGTGVTVEFIRHRNALLARADFAPLFTDYYLHLADNKLRYTPEQDGLFRSALAAFTLHCASRPLNEHLAWTINFQAPRLNIFLAGDNEDCNITGRLFTENVREAAENVFFSDIMPRRGTEPRRSVVNFRGDVRAAVEGYYARSEQRPARLFELGGDEYALLVAQPDCDLAWFSAADAETVRNLATAETLALIQRRNYGWHCGCTQQKILAAIAPAFRADPAGLFGDGETIRVECPRCAAAHTLTREAMEAYLAEVKKPA